MVLIAFIIAFFIDQYYIQGKGMMFVIEKLGV